MSKKMKALYLNLFYPDRFYFIGGGWSADDNGLNGEMIEALIRDIQREEW